jgi:hypothetical protein
VIKIEPPGASDPLRVLRELDVDGTSVVQELESEQEECRNRYAEGTRKRVSEPIASPNRFVMTSRTGYER